MANGLTSVIANIGYECKNTIFNEDKVREATAMQTILNNALEAVEKTMKIEPIEIQDITNFLSSPEVATIIRQIYSARFLEKGNSKFLDSIQEEFYSNFATSLGKNEGFNKEPAKLLLNAIIDGCDYGLALAIDNGILSAHEAKSSLRYHILRDELDAIQKILDFFYTQEKPDLQKILDFEKKYRRQVSGRRGIIIPPHFDRSQKIPINELYVNPNFLKLSRKKDEGEFIFDMDIFLSLIHRTVLIGSPGCGKSTLTHKISFDLSNNYSKLAERQITPIIVVLKDYGVEKKKNKCSIIQFIESTANSTYQVEPPKNAIEYMLLNGYVAVIFDGLDELIDTSYRQEISDDIESFSLLYPSAPILVTSREVGYWQAPLHSKKFEVFRLAPFDPQQVKNYVEKWFAIDSELNYEMREARATSFMKESEFVPDLRSNPLMLALICNIYQGENYIPNNRPEVYEKCATMLFERWDRSRGIPIPRSVEEIKAHVRPTMMYLAYWIYSDETLQGGVTERDLISKAAEYLNEKRFDDLDESKDSAQGFIEFCKGRAWVFTDTGTTKEGEGLYQFTHRTFLEYFTAAYLVRINPTPKELREVLFPRIINQEWDLVAQLAFQTQNKNVEGAADELMIWLINIAIETRSYKYKWNIFSFVVRCLEFIVPRPATTRQIVSAVIDGLLIVECRKVIDISQIQKIWCDLLDCASENQKILYDAIENIFVEIINTRNDSDALLALLLTYYLKCSIQKSEKRRDFCKFKEPCQKAYERILYRCSSKNEMFCEKYSGVCHLATWRGIIPMDKYLNWHGIAELLESHQDMLFRHWGRTSMANKLLMPLVDIRSRFRLNEHLHDLEAVGNLLLNASIPFIKESQIEHSFKVAKGMTHYFRDSKPFALPENLIKNTNALFGALALTMFVFESMKLEP